MTRQGGGEHGRWSAGLRWRQEEVVVEAGGWIAQRGCLGGSPTTPGTSFGRSLGWCRSVSTALEASGMTLRHFGALVVIDPEGHGSPRVIRWMGGSTGRRWSRRSTTWSGWGWSSGGAQGCRRAVFDLTRTKTGRVAPRVAEATMSDVESVLFSPLAGEQRRRLHDLLNRLLALGFGWRWRGPGASWVGCRQ